MSVNWREIDLILEEVPLQGGYIRKLSQPDFRNFLFALWLPPTNLTMRVCLEHPFVRFHTVTSPPRIKRSHQRFESFLHARVVGGQIQSARQLYQDRIVEITVTRNQETTILYLRLWGGHSNLIATDENHRILDAAFRKPNQHIVTGETYLPVEPNRPEPCPTGQEKPAPAWPVREYTGTFHSFIESQYAEAEESRTRKQRMDQAERMLTRNRGRLLSRLAEIERGTDRSEQADSLLHQAQLIMANLYRISPGEKSVIVEDYADNNRPVSIRLDPLLPATTYAANLFARVKRSQESKEFLDQSAASLRSRLRAITDQIEQLPQMDTLSLIALVTAGKNVPRNNQSADVPETGLRFTSSGYQILVGRNARENDALLRKYVRGNDLWLHTRDYPGGYVFVKTPKGKSVPLDVLLDAGTLALFFSKARENGRGELYYTQVKYLRRSKDGPPGLVLPTQEKNLSVIMEKNRLIRMGLLENSL